MSANLPPSPAFPDARLLVFAKAPVPGQVKTRLIPVLGPIGAARLAEDLLRGTLARLLPTRGAGSCGFAGRAADSVPVATGLAAVELWCAPDTAHPVFQALARAYPLRLRQQRGADLGARLYAASAEALGRADAVVLIGCDCPDLDAAYLTAALQGLADHDAVLGPATDGGYVLLGLRRAAPTLFSGLPWGTGQVAALTRERMAALGWRWLELPVLADLDRPEDLTSTQRRRWGAVRIRGF